MVLTISHIDDQETRHFIETNFVTILMKPFEVTDLLRAVRTASNGKSAKAGTP
jgi:DNA-binding NarL/FixJ family response regulator